MRFTWEIIMVHPITGLDSRTGVFVVLTEVEAVEYAKVNRVQLVQVSQ